MWRLGDRVRPDRLCDPESPAIENRASRLGSDIARPDPRTAGGEHDLGHPGEVRDRSRNLILLVRDDAARHVEAVCRQQLGEDVAALVLTRARNDTIRHGEHSGFHDFVFSSRRTSSIASRGSTPLTMS